MRLGDLDALKKEVENLVVGGEKGLKDYYENGSKSDENSWIGGVYDAWELICNAQTVEPSAECEKRPQGDLISRSDVKNYARKVMYEKNATNFSLLKMFDEIIDNAPRHDWKCGYPDITRGEK